MKRIAIGVLAALLSLQSLAHASEIAFPKTLESTEFNQVLTSVGEDLYIAGQPTAEGLETLRESGVTTVINLRTSIEMDNREVVAFDEQATVASLGMRYVHIPSGGPDTPYAPAMVDAFAKALETAEGKVLLHCTVAWRASHLYAAYLYRHRGLSLERAVEHGRAINLGTLPLEGFLGESLVIQPATTP